MKHGKLLWLLVALLSLTLLLASCTGGTNGEETTSGETTGGEQEQTANEMSGYLLLEKDYTLDPISFAEIEQIEGELVATDAKHKLIAVKTQDLDNYNMVTDTVTVYDLKTGEALVTTDVKNALDEDPNKKINLAVTLDYPVIRVSKFSGEVGDETYDVSYYLAKKGSEAIRTTTDNEYERHDFENGLSSFQMGKEVVWIDRNMEIVRTVDALAANGYDVEGFEAEYEGYLYTWDDKNLQIFNRQGICSGKFSLPSVDSAFEAFVLDNGNVLIQVIEYVSVYEEYDFIMMGQRCRLSSMIMNCVDGSIKEIDLDFIVDDLETAYAAEYDAAFGFPFMLAPGRHNQAIIQRFSAGRLADLMEYVVLNNDVEVQYTLKNTTQGIDYTMAWVVSESLYSAYVWEAGAFGNYLFDLDGNCVAASPYHSVTEKYIVTRNAIYDLGMNLVYDFVQNGFELYFVDEVTGKIYLDRRNFQTGGYEIHVFNDVSKEPLLLTDGIETSLSEAGRGYYILHDLETEKYSFCNADGKKLLVTLGRPTVQMFDDAYVVTSEFEGKTMLYVLR